MAPRRPAGVVMAEEAMAARIRLERERNEMTPAQLADWMTKAGCPMNQSAIWKIENGEPRRRITLNEAITFAKVLGLPLEELTQPPEVVAASRVADKLEQLRQDDEKRRELFSRWGEAIEEIRQEIADDPTGTVARTLNRIVTTEEKNYSGFDEKFWQSLKPAERLARAESWADICVEDDQLYKIECTDDVAAVRKAAKRVKEMQRAAERSSGQPKEKS